MVLILTPRRFLDDEDDEDDEDDGSTSMAHISCDERARRLALIKERRVMLTSYEGMLQLISCVIKEK